MRDDLTELLDRGQRYTEHLDAQTSTVTRRQVQNIADLYAMYPNLGSAAVSLGLAGVPRDHPAVKKAAQAHAAKQARTPPPAGEQVTGGWLSRAVSDFGDGFVGSLKSITRYGTAGAMAPYEYVQGFYRGTEGSIRAGLEGPGAFNLGQANQYLEDQGSLGDMTAQTTVGAGINEASDRGQLGGMLLGQGDEDIAGGGWFIDPKESVVGRRQGRAARAMGTAYAHDGAEHAYSPGRTLADVVFEPGSRGFNIMSGLVDMTTMIVADPVGLTGAAVAKAGRASKVLDRGRAVEVQLPAKIPAPGSYPNSRAEFDLLEVGLVDGLRKTVLPERAASWLNSGKGNTVTERIAETTDYNTLKRVTKSKLPVDVMIRLLDAPDSVTVKNVLADAISEGAMREAVGFKVKKPPPRLAGMMPGTKLDLDDMDDAVEQFHRMQVNARVPDPLASRNNEALARAISNGERLQIVETAMQGVKDSLIHNGLPSAMAHQTTRLFSNRYNELVKYAVDDVGENVAVPWAQVGANRLPLPTPTLASELVDRYIPLPDGRDMKRAARTHAWLRTVEGSAPVNIVRDVADVLTNDLFKPFALALRPAWTVRVVGEEQIRMAAAGQASLFRHPLSYASIVIGMKPGGILAQSLEKAGGTPSLTRDMKGRAFHEEGDLAEGLTEAAQALNVGSAGWKDVHLVAQRGMTTVDRTHPQYAEGWHAEIVQLATDPVAREIARNGVPATKELFWAGGLQAERLRWDQAFAMRNARTPGSPRFDLGVRANADAFVDETAARLNTKTQGHSALIAAVATGNVDAAPLLRNLKPSGDAREVFQRLADEGHGPTMVKTEVIAATGRHKTAAQVGERYEQTFEALFNALGSVPTNRLSRSPMFRQSYWARTEELLPLMTAAARNHTLQAAREAGVSKAQIARMRDTVKGQAVAGKLGVDAADKVAKQFGLKQTRRLLYSLHEKSQAADALRVLFPFGEAWKEVLTRWAMLARENPNVPYRAAQAITNAQETGFFHPDPQTGDEMYSLPGSEWLTKKLTGVPVRFDAPVKGLNMFGQVLPGVGPVVTIPAGKIIPETPEWDWAREQVMPFGEGDPNSGALERFYPAYIKKLQGLGFFSVVGSSPTPDQKRALASTARDTMAYLASTGDYDLTTPEGQDQLIQDAKDKARSLYLIRALVQSTAPSAPSPRFAAQDKDGRLHALHLMQADYRDMLNAQYEQDGPDATQAFLDKYGDDAFLVTVNKTRGEFSTTEAVSQLTRSNPAQARMFPDVIGYFAPDSDVYSFDELDRQIEAGTRQVISVEDAVELGNIRVAASIYRNAIAKVGDNPSPEQKNVMRALKAALGEKYPGYVGKPDNLAQGPAQIQQLQRAVKDPVLAKTDAGQGLSLYLDARDIAIAKAKEVNPDRAGFQTSQDTQHLRTIMRRLGEAIVVEHPDFEQMWDRVFEREMRE